MPLIFLCGIFFPFWSVAQVAPPKEVPTIPGVIKPDQSASKPDQTVGSVQSEEDDDSAERNQARREQLSKIVRSKKHRKGSNTAMDSFMRVKRNQKRKPVAFETSVTRYIGKDNQGETVYVDLIGVVHIGEKEYYEELNDIFKKYDSVLYELVAPEGTVIPKGGGQRDGMNPIAGLQVAMQSVLGLKFQLEHINYEKSNFVHADMSPEEFMKSMKDNDESFGKMFLKAMGQSMAQSGQTQMSNFDLLAVAFAKDKEIKMRQLFADQMIDMEGGMAIFEGRDGSTIINHRNGKAMEVLEEVLDDGKKKIAVFYGAGHLPDMERRLTSDFKLKRGGQYWLEAWKLKR
ncbi:MAG: hypothetical protein AAGA30_15645 [Planctomycetota bacterium]